MDIRSIVGLDRGEPGASWSLPGGPGSTVMAVGCRVREPGGIEGAYLRETHSTAACLGGGLPALLLETSIITHLLLSYIKFL